MSGGLALKASTGKVAWSSPIYGRFPVVSRGVVYYLEPENFYHGTVYALRASTGARLWTTTLCPGCEEDGAELFTSPPVPARGVVYVSKDDGSIYALDAATGSAHLTVKVSGGAGEDPHPRSRRAGCSLASGTPAHQTGTSMAYRSTGAAEFALGHGNVDRQSPIGGLRRFLPRESYALKSSTGAKIWSFLT